MLQRWNVCSIDGLRVVCYQAGAILCMRDCMWRGRADHGRVVPVAVIMAVPCPSWPSVSVVVMSWRPGCGRAWPSCMAVVTVAWRRGRPSLGCDHGRDRRGPGRRVRRGRGAVVFVSRHVVATRRRMLVFAMVLVVSVLSWFAI